MILANNQSKPASIKSLAEKVSYQVRELMTRTEDIIWSLKIKEGQVETIAKRVNEYASDLIATQEMQCKVDIDPELEALIIKPEHRRSILMIIKEAMNNCRKYSGANLFILSMKIVHKEIVLMIEDNGKGFDERVVVYGDGIQNIKNRCLAMSGFASITSQPTTGTQIKCHFPIAIFSQKS